jgi:hypothetical protein
MRYPYILTSPLDTIRLEADFDNERGVVYKSVEGEHAIWAARVPFLPAMVSADFTRFGHQRIPLIQQRQFRFIYDLARAREHRATFELRFIATPNPVPGQPNLIDIVFLGKVFSSRTRGGQELAERLWEKFVSNFPLEDPFNYPLEPVLAPEQFQALYEPFSFAELEPRNLLEIRKYEDMPLRGAAPLGRVQRVGDYIAHPFVPSVDFGPMARFFAALANHDGRCFAGVSLRPTRLFDQEIFNVSFAIGQFRKVATESADVAEEYHRVRSVIGANVYQQLMFEREQAVQIRVQLVRENGSPFALAEALGSEMMGHVEDQYPTQFSLVQPSDDAEFALARHNLRFLEHDPWGHTIAAAPLQRLRYLATPHEAYGAFRLPVPPESGYLPGVEVRNEPFVAPNEVTSSPVDQADPQIDLGWVYHRGNPTLRPFSLRVRSLTRHTMVAGSTGSGKSTTIKYLLGQLWTRHRIPFLVLYPVDKSDYRELRGFDALAADLLIFTLGDEGTSPFRFNPFEVPDGILLKTHLSRLMRVFSAAFTLQDPLPMIYREALRRVYREAGWDPVLDRGAPGKAYPLMSDFYQAIRAITESLRYGREVQDNVRQASVIRIGDLLENAGHVVNVRQSLPLSKILEQPTVMEIGRVGSPQDTTLLMGFLLMRFAEEIERNPRPEHRPHVTVVEEAHRLMAEVGPSVGSAADSRASAGEDFSNILAEVRGHGEGLIIAEQIPTLLVKGAIGNTFVKIAHWLEDPASFDLFGRILNLTPDQQEYARTLLPGFAIVRGADGRPVHVKVPDFKALPDYDTVFGRAISDTDVREYMVKRRVSLGIPDVPVIPWSATLAAESPNESASLPSQQLQSLLLGAPMQTCAFCTPLLATRQCKHGVPVRNRLVGDVPFYDARTRELDAALADADPEARWRAIRQLGATVEGRAPAFPPAVRAEIAYCFLAHLVDPILRERSLDDGKRERQKRSREILHHFQARYSMPARPTEAN